MKKIRLKFLLLVYTFAQKYYRKIFKRKTKQWNFTEAQLLEFEKDSLGKKLGEFYKENGFRMIPQMEHHDVHHLITNYGTKMQDEIALQFLLLGNGKRSAYLFGAVFLGTIVFPEYYQTYFRAYKKGKSMIEFYHWDFEKILHQNFENLKLFIYKESIF